MTDSTPRWQYRFAHYRRALSLLREAIQALTDSGLSQLEKEGTIQRFEFTVELAWKVMKDYLEHEGIVFEQMTPRVVIRKAFEAGVTTHGPLWMDALDARNRMSHTYDFAEFEQVVEDIRTRYLVAMEDLAGFLAARESDDA